MRAARNVLRTSHIPLLCQPVSRVQVLMTNENMTRNARGLTLALSFTMLSLELACGGGTVASRSSGGAGAPSSSGGASSTAGAASLSGGASLSGAGGVLTECPPSMQTGGPCSGNFACNYPGPCTACGCCSGASECRDGVMVYLGFNDGCTQLCGSAVSSGGVGGGSFGGAGGASSSAGAGGEGGVAGAD